MSRGRVFGSTVVLFAVLLFPSEASSVLVINEFLADPPAGQAGDANRDGVRSASQDEFVELFNTGQDPADLSAWSLADSSAIRHRFAQGVSLGPFEYFVVFSGGSPAGFSGQVVTASSGSLRLNNSGDQISLRDAQGQRVDQVVYDAAASRDQSLVRLPEGTGPFELHRGVSSLELLFSPGTDPEGMIPVPDLPEPLPVSTTPEPASALLLGAGWVVMRIYGACFKPPSD